MTFFRLDPRRARGQATPVTISGLLSQAEQERAVARLADIFTPAELARLEHVKRVRAMGDTWRLKHAELERGLFVRALIAAVLIGEGDRG